MASEAVRSSRTGVAFYGHAAQRPWPVSVIALAELVEAPADAEASQGGRGYREGSAAAEPGQAVELWRAGWVDAAAGATATAARCRKNGARRYLKAKRRDRGCLRR